MLEKVTLGDKLFKLRLVIVGARSKGAVKEQPDTGWVESLLIQSRRAGVAIVVQGQLEHGVPPAGVPGIGERQAGGVMELGDVYDVRIRRVAAWIS